MLVEHILCLGSPVILCKLQDRKCSGLTVMAEQRENETKY